MSESGGYGSETDEAGAQQEGSGAGNVAPPDASDSTGDGPTLPDDSDDSGSGAESLPQDVGVGVGRGEPSSFEPEEDPGTIEPAD